MKIKNFNFTSRTNRANENLYLVINSTKIIMGTWQQIKHDYLIMEENITNQIISDLIIYGNSGFTFNNRTYCIYTNEEFYKYLEVICNKDILLLNEYFKNIGFNYLN